MLLCMQTIARICEVTSLSLSERSESSDDDVGGFNVSKMPDCPDIGEIFANTISVLLLCGRGVEAKL